jgi:hypothetical protein
MAVCVNAGTAEVDITPAPGCAMIHRHADDGIHDPLWVRTLAFSCGDRRVAVAGLDLISLSSEQVARVRERLWRRLGLGPANVWLCCSHTHSGPVTNTYRGWGRPDPAYIDALIGRVAGCVEAAFQRQVPCRLGYGEASLQVGYNRRLDQADGSAQMQPNPAGLVDTAVRALRVTDARTGKVMGVLFSHGCHPVVLHLASRMVSSDWPGRAAEYLKAELGADVCTVFAQGCGGDANSVVLNGTFADRDRLGVLAGQAALAAVRQAGEVMATGLATALKVVPLPVRLPTRDEAAAALAWEQQRVERMLREHASPESVTEAQEAGIAWAQDLCRIAAGQRTEGIALDIAAVALGEALCIVGLGAEAFHAYQGICQELSPWPRTLVLGCVNGASCYLPTAAEFARKGYETAADSYAAGGSYAYKRYGTLALTPDCEAAVRRGVAETLAGLRQSPDSTR